MELSLPLSNHVQQSPSWCYQILTSKVTHTALKLSTIAFGCIAVLSFFEPYNSFIGTGTFLWCSIGASFFIRITLCVINHYKEQSATQVKNTLRERIHEAPLQEHEVMKLKELIEIFAQNACSFDKFSKEVQEDAKKSLRDRVCLIIDDYRFQKAPLQYLRECNYTQQCATGATHKKNKVHDFLKNTIILMRSPALIRATNEDLLAKNLLI